MRFYAKMSALGVVAVLSTAIASATTYQYGSYATSPAPNFGNQNSAMVFVGPSSTPDPGVVYVPTTVAVDPGTVWHAALPNSSWVSFGQTGPTTPAASQPGGHFAPNGDYFFTTTFTLDSQATSFIFSILADDTTSVFLDGQTGNALVGASSGNNIICNTVTPNCLDVTTVTQADVPAALALLTAGTHTLTFDIQQIRSFDLGIDFSAVVTTAGPIPEPSSLLLLGTGLIGSAGALLRRTRAARR